MSRSKKASKIGGFIVAPSLTSDSIAAWMAEQISATHLLIIKHQAAEVNKTNLDHLQMSGVVDRGFKQSVSDACFETSILGEMIQMPLK